MSRDFASLALNAAKTRAAHPPLAWLLLGCGVLGLCWSLVSLNHVWALQDQHAAAVLQAKQQQVLQKKELAQRQTQDRQTTARLAQEQQLREVLLASWDGALTALELSGKAVRGGVTLLTLSPVKADAQTLQYRVSALAANAPIMLAYASALQADPSTVQATLLSQQVEDKNGTGAQRFQMSVTFSTKLRPQVVPPDKTPSAPVTAIPTVRAEGAK